eukprot:3373165-Prymnesium_polylepis.1
MHARGGAVLSLRWAEGPICFWVCCADSMMACSRGRALLCLSSGGMRSDAQCLMSAFGRRWCERAEQ